MILSTDDLPRPFPIDEEPLKVTEQDVFGALPSPWNNVLLLYKLLVENKQLVPFNIIITIIKTIKHLNNFSVANSFI